VCGYVTRDAWVGALEPGASCVGILLVNGERHVFERRNQICEGDSSYAGAEDDDPDGLGLVDIMVCKNVAVGRFPVFGQHGDVGSVTTLTRSTRNMKSAPASTFFFLTACSPSERHLND